MNSPVVLVLDDDPEPLDDMTEMVKGLGASVLVCVDIESAVDALNRTEKPDLAILDWNVGLDTTSRCVAEKAVSLGIQVVIISNTPDRVPGDTGASRVLDKWDRELEHQIATLLEPKSRTI